MKSVENIKKPVDHAEAERVEIAIAMVRQNIMAMGNNDSEFDRLNQTLDAYENGEKTAEEAISEARAIEINKVER